MSVRIVLDDSDRHLWLRAGRTAATLAGGLLLLGGLAVSLLPVILGARLGVRLLTESPADLDPRPVALQAAIFAIIALILLLAGLVMLRGSRRVVLFLRRFGHRDATAAVTFAAAKTVGSSWRIVTLDDADVAPVGLAAWPRTLAVSAESVRQLGVTSSRRMREATRTVFQLAYSAGLLTVLYLSVSRDAWGDAALTYLFELTSAVQERRLPDLPADSDLRTAVLVLLATGLTFLIAPHLLRLLGTTIWLLMLIPDQVVASSATAVRRAELATRAKISTGAELVSVTRIIVRQSRRILAPRLVVLRTDHTVWQDAVRHLAAISEVTLVDVSDPTESLLWELQELAARFGSRWLLVGRYDQVRHLADPRNVFPPGSVVARLADLLDGHEILAYTTDRRGQRRFARALRVRFTALSRPVVPQQPEPAATVGAQ